MASSYTSWRKLGLFGLGVGAGAAAALLLAPARGRAQRRKIMDRWRITGP